MPTHTGLLAALLGTRRRRTLEAGYEIDYDRAPLPCAGSTRHEQQHDGGTPAPTRTPSSTTELVLPTPHTRS